MANIFLISDTHFGHANILTFTRSDGSKVRDFSSVEEMDEHIVDRWNSVVRPQDHVYHLGDVAMNAKCIPTVARLLGKKRLVLGNHDSTSMKDYAGLFEKVCGTRHLDRFLLSHVPVHPDSIGKSLANVHGHLHNSHPQGHLGPRYYNVSCEMLDYTPIALETLKVLILERNQEEGQL